MSTATIPIFSKFLESFFHLGIFGIKRTKEWLWRIDWSENSFKKECLSLYSSCGGRPLSLYHSDVIFKKIILSYKMKEKTVRLRRISNSRLRFLLPTWFRYCSNTSEKTIGYQQIDQKKMVFSFEWDVKPRNFDRFCFFNKLFKWNLSTSYWFGQSLCISHIFLFSRNLYSVYLSTRALLSVNEIKFKHPFVCSIQHHTLTLQRYNED